MKMDGKIAIEMLNEINKQEDVRVAKILRLRWGTEFINEDSRCETCHRELFVGDVGHVWGKPINNEEDCTILSMIGFCADDQCVERAMEAWSWELKKDVMAAYFGNFDGDDLDLG